MEEDNKKVWKVILVSLLVLTLAVTAFWLILEDKTIQIEQLNNKYKNISADSTELIHILNIQTAKKDSAVRVLNNVAPYMPMMEILSFRDSVLSKLPAKTGDVVYLKPDSMHCVIKSIIIKSGKWQNDVEFVIFDKNQREITIEPELIYIPKIKKF